MPPQNVNFFDSVAKSYKNNKLKLMEASTKIVNDNPIGSVDDIPAVKKALEEVAGNLLVCERIHEVAVSVNILPKEVSQEVTYINWKDGGWMRWMHRIGKKGGKDKVKVDAATFVNIMVACTFYKKTGVEGIRQRGSPCCFYKLTVRQVPNLGSLAARNVNKLLLKYESKDLQVLLKYESKDLQVLRKHGGAVLPTEQLTENRGDDAKRGDDLKRYSDYKEFKRRFSEKIGIPVDCVDYLKNDIVQSDSATFLLQ